MSIQLILHNIRSIHNVGSIFRTADAVGVEKIYLTGYSPTPQSDFVTAGQAPKMAKTALGAEKTVPWEYRKQIGPLLKKLKQDKVQIVALEQSPKSIDYKKFKPASDVVLVIGNEVRGVSQAILTKMDVVIEIPMRGKKESLNVAVAAGVALYELTRA